MNSLNFNRVVIAICSRRALTCVLLAFVLSSCTARSSSLMRFVPQDSCAILSVDWSTLTTDEDLRRVIKAREFEDWLQSLRIDRESIKTVVVFSGIDSQRVSGFLLRGVFDSRDIVADLKTEGWKEESTDGQRVYVQNSNYIGFPSKNTLAGGTRDAVLGVFRAGKNAEESIVSSPSYKKINSGISANDHKPVKAYLLIPQGTLDMADAALTATSFALSFFNLGGIGQLLKAVNVAKGFAFTLDRGNRDRYPVELCVLMRDEEAAVFVSGSLNALKELSELAATDARDQEAIREFRKMTISRKEEVLTLKMEMPADALFPPAHR